MLQKNLSLLTINKNWDKMAIFETTAKNSVLERWGPDPHLKYEKKIQKFYLSGF
jgi:hypothetical protein